MLPHAVDVANANDAVVVHADDVACHQDNVNARHALRRGDALFVRWIEPIQSIQPIQPIQLIICNPLYGYLL